MLLKKDELTQEDKEEILDEISDYKDSIQKNIKILFDWIDKTQEELKQ